MLPVHVSGLRCSLRTLAASGVGSFLFVSGKLEGMLVPEVHRSVQHMQPCCKHPLQRRRNERISMLIVLAVTPILVSANRIVNLCVGLMILFTCNYSEI